jgi:hypothetical protein
MSAVEMVNEKAKKTEPVKAEPIVEPAVVEETLAYEVMLRQMIKY